MSAMVFFFFAALFIIALFCIVSALNSIASALRKPSDKQKVKSKDYVEVDGLIYELVGFDQNQRPLVRVCPDVKLLSPNQVIHQVKL